MKQMDPRLEKLQVLDLPAQASWQEVQARFRQLVLSYHPDVNPSKQSSEHFRRIAEAYETLAQLRRQRQARSTEELARMNEDPRVRRLSTEELQMRLLYSSSPELRAAAAYLLGERYGKESRRVVLRAVRDPDTYVRRVALEAIGEIGRPGDLFPFMALLFNREGETTMKRFFGSALRIWLRTLKRISPLHRSSKRFGEPGRPVVAQERR